MKGSKKIISATLALALAITAVYPGGIIANAAVGNKIGKPVIVNHAPTKKVDANSYAEIPSGEVVTLDNNLADDNASMRVIANVQECLTRQEYDAKGNVVNGPGAAEKWEVSPDGKTWTFYLRKMNWSDGKPVTAKDFEYSWLRLLDRNVASQYSYFIYFIKGAEEYNKGKGKISDVGVRALSQSKFQVILKRPTPHFERVLAFPILAPIRADIVKKLGDKFGTQSSFKQMVWSGPFTVDTWSHAQKVIMLKNPKYWDAAKVKLTKVIYHLAEYELATQIQMFQNYKLDRTAASGDWLNKLKTEATSGKFRYYFDTNMNCRYFTFNQNANPALKNAKVRKALALSIDREAFCSVVMKRFVPRFSLIPAKMMSGNVEFRKTSKDWINLIAKENPDPKKLLIEGLKEAKLNADPAKLEIEYLTYGGNSVEKKRIEFFQGQFKKNLGIDLKIKVLADWGQFCKERDNKNFQMVYEGWGADYNDPMTFLDMWVTGGTQNKASYKSAAYDKLIADASKEQNMTKRNVLLVAAEKKLIYEDCAIAPISTDDTQSFIHNYLINQDDFSFGSEFDFKYAYTSGRVKK